MNIHGIRAIYKFEMARMWRTLMQSVASPVISTSLYFVVFGSAIGPGVTGLFIDLGVDFPEQMLPIALYYLAAAALAGWAIHRYRPKLPT